MENMRQTIRILDAKHHVGQEVTLEGWLFNIRSSGKIFFLQVRDGSGIMQAVAAKGQIPDEDFSRCEQLTQESSIRVQGTIREEPRSPGGFELQVTRTELLHQSAEYPIAKKEHGIEFLLDQRHLWIRTPRQVAILRIRDQIIWSMRSFFREQGFILTDTPILTPTACEGTTTLFETDYFDEKAYLSQSGQLYLEALAAALGQVYDFGPTFRAEKSKTRRHLIEFWMLDAEAAFMVQEESIKLQEELVIRIIKDVLASCSDQLAVIERNLEPLKRITGSFPRMTYDDAISWLQKKGSDIQSGDDLGADDETLLSNAHEKPVFITHYPTAIRAFYMKPDPQRADRVLCADLLAPEGYGEMIGGSQRIDDLQLLEKRFAEHKLPQKDFEWYLDLRRYGSFPHSGFGIGLERTVAWICGLEHVREAIPFPRLLNRLRP